MGFWPGSEEAEVIEPLLPSVLRMSENASPLGLKAAEEEGGEEVKEGAKGLEWLAGRVARGGPLGGSFGLRPPPSSLILRFWRKRREEKSRAEEGSEW